MGMAMDGGEIVDGIITCPYHGFQYSLASGRMFNRARSATATPCGARKNDGQIEVRLIG